MRVNVPIAPTDTEDITMARDIALSPASFAKTFTRGFAAAIREAAGKDQRLSLNEAGKVAEPYRDNALNYLTATGQKSVGVEKLIASGYRYAHALLACGRQIIE